jgi:transposase
MTDRARGREGAPALAYTDMRKGIDGFAALVQELLKRDPFSGHLFASLGKRTSILKVLLWDGTDCACSPSASIAVASYGCACTNPAAQ